MCVCPCTNFMQQSIARILYFLKWSMNLSFTYHEFHCRAKEPAYRPLFEPYDTIQRVTPYLFKLNFNIIVIFTMNLKIAHSLQVLSKTSHTPIVHSHIQNIATKNLHLCVFSNSASLCYVMFDWHSKYKPQTRNIVTKPENIEHVVKLSVNTEFHLNWKTVVK
jgi:hypothetical protein